MWLSSLSSVFAITASFSGFINRHFGTFLCIFSKYLLNVIWFTFLLVLDIVYHELCVLTVKSAGCCVDNRSDGMVLVVVS